MDPNQKISKNGTEITIFLIFSDLLAGPQSLPPTKKNHFFCQHNTLLSFQLTRLWNIADLQMIYQKKGDLPWLS